MSSSYAVNGVRLPCYISGIAYANLIQDGENTNDGIISAETLRVLCPSENSVNFECSSHSISTKDEIYSDRALCLTASELKTMPLIGGPIEFEHSRSTKSGSIGIITNSWQDKNRVRIEAEIHDAEVAQRVRAGELNGLSIRYGIIRRGDKVIRKIFKEVSICANQAFPECLIDMRANKSSPLTSDDASDYKNAFADKSSGFYIDSVSDEPIGNQIKKIKATISPSDAFNIPDRNQMDQSAGSSLPPAAETRTPPSMDKESSTQPSDQASRPPSDASNEADKKKNKYLKEEEDAEKKQKKFYIKEQKRRAQKEELKRYQAADAAKNEQYVRTQEVKKKAFLDHYATHNGEMTEEERVIIEQSFTKPEYARWAAGLDNMKQKAAALAEEKRVIELERDQLQSQASKYKRKAEKHKMGIKYLKNTDGDRVKQKQPADRQTTVFDTNVPKKAVFDQPSATSTAPSAIKSQAFSLPGRPDVKYYSTGAPSPIETMFTKQGRSSEIDIAASNFPEGKSSGGFMSNFSPEMQQAMNHYAKVSPYEEAGKYLNNRQKHQPGVSQVPGRLGGY